MRTITRFFCALGLTALLASSAPGQQPYPPPVDIPIPNLTQQTPVWCWAAVAQQIIMASRGPGGTPAQCALVAAANGAPPQTCCGGYNPQCVVTGSLPQIQFLIGQFGGQFSTIAPPAYPSVLYQTLAQGHPIILQIASGQGTAHVVVLRGMSFVPTPTGVEAVLHINDPLAYFTQPVPFSQIVGMWVSAIVVN